MRYSTRPLMTLDFDIENAPRSYWVPDNPTADITAIAVCWTDLPESGRVWLLKPSYTRDEYREQMHAMLTEFVEYYNAAEMVTGHYIRKHDLPIINGALMDWGLPILGPKLAQDTKVDMVKKSDIPATQEYLLEMLEIEEQKFHMTQHRWRDANRLTEEGLALAEERVVSDVRGHIKLREEMIKRGLLHPPRIWRP